MKCVDANHHRLSLATNYILDISSSIMDARHVALCLFLIIGLNGKPTSAGLCSYLYVFHHNQVYFMIYWCIIDLYTNSFLSPSCYSFISFF